MARGEMPKLWTLFASESSLASLMAAERAIVIVNCLCALIFGIAVIGPVGVIVVLGILVIYRAPLLLGVVNRIPAAQWWYCVATTVFVIRFGAFLAAVQGKIPGLNFDSPKDSVSPLSCVVLVIILAVRSAGVARVFIELSKRAKVTAAIAIVAAVVSIVRLPMFALILVSIESFLYGFIIALH
jgi:hypothetical protein